MYGEGISKEGSLIDLGVETGIVTKSGSWFTYGEMQLGQGKENARKFLKDNPELAEEIEDKVLIAVGIRENPGASAPDSASAAEKSGEDSATENLAVVMDDTNDNVKQMRKVS